MAKSSRESYLPQKRDLASLVLHYESEEMAQAYPALYQLMCHAKRDGNFRAGSRLTLFADQGRIKACISDPDSNQVWFATLDGFRGALEAIEDLVSSRRGEWREQRPQRR